MIRHPLSPAFFPLALLVWIVTGPVACKEERTSGPIESVRVLAEVDVDLEATSMDRFGYRKPEPLFLFDLPLGWQEVAPATLRDLNLSVTGPAGDAECYVSILTGGGTLENINRWRRQMSLEPYSDEELRELPVIDFLGRRSVLVDLEGTFAAMSGPPLDGARMLGCYAAFPRVAFSLKMVGPAETVAAHRDAYEQFASQLKLNPERFGPAANEVNSGGAAAEENAPSFDQGKLTWTKAPHWVPGVGSDMRACTYDVPGKPGAQAWVTVLPGRSGTVLQNLNRWRSELGLSAWAKDDLGKLPQLRVLGRDSLLLEAEGRYQGMSGSPIDDAMMLGVICELGDGMLFVKMVGRKADLMEERSHFIAFCESLNHP